MLSLRLNTSGAFNKPFIVLIEGGDGDVMIFICHRAMAAAGLIMMAIIGRTGIISRPVPCALAFRGEVNLGELL